MILPEDRYRFSGKKRKNRKPFYAVSVIVIALLAGGAVFLLVKRSESPVRPMVKYEEPQTIEALWENQHYETINKRCEEILAVDPMNKKALVYNGFSYFYRGTSQYSLEEKIPLFDSAIVNLRKALLVCDNVISGKVKYIIGKCYFQKGPFYTDLAIKYLEESKEDGYTEKDTFEYLGMLYYKLGKYDVSVANYLKAIEKQPTDMLYLVLAQSYIQLGSDEEAEKYLDISLKSTDNFSVEQKARYLLGKLLIDKGELDRAKEEYLKILEKNDKAADAHFYLGDIYFRMGDNVKARYEWRKCVEIKPNHYGANLKLYG